MARIQYGSIITAMKGNVGGQTFQNGNTAQVLRNKGYRKGNSTPLRSTQTRILGTVNAQWRGLTDTQRTAWAAVTTQWPFKDKFGKTYFGTPYQVYSAYNTALMNMGLPQATAPGTPVTGTDPGSFSFTELDSSVIELLWTNAIEITQYIRVFASAPVSVGRNGNNIRMKLIHSSDADGINDIDCTAGYIAAWGQLVSGSRVFVRVEFRVPSFPITQYLTYFNGIVG